MKIIMDRLMLHIHYKFLSLLVCVLLLWTEGAAREVSGNTGLYSHWNNIMLPNDANVVNVVFQDAGGMIWLGTKRGLFSYNGYDARRFSIAIVQTIVQADSLHFYVGTDDGISLFNMRTEQFEPLPDDLANIGAVRSLMPDGDLLWIGTRDKGLWCYDLKHHLLRQDKLQGTVETMVFALEKGDGGFYVGSIEHLSFYSYNTHKRSVCFSRELEDLGLSALKVIYSLHYEASSGSLWVGTEKKLLRFDTRQHKVMEINSVAGNTVKSMTMDALGNLLLGTDTGLLILPSSSYSWQGDDGGLRHIGHDIHNPKSIRNNVIWDVLCDSQGNVWLGTDRGISTTQLHTDFLLTTLAELSNSAEGNLFTAVYKDSQGELWLGGDNGLIHVTQKGGFTWFSADSRSHPLRDNKVWKIYEDRDRNIWIATDASIACYNRRADRFDYYVLHDSKGHKTFWAYDIWEDHRQRLWVAAYHGGLYVVDKQALTASDGEYVIAHNPFGEGGVDCSVFQLVPDGNGNLWLNLGNSLARVDTRTLEVERIKVCMDYMTYADNAVWFSENGMLRKYDLATGKISDTAFADKEGMIYTIVAENANIWFSTAKGIYRMNTQTGGVNMMYVPDNYYKAVAYDALTDELIWAGEDCMLRYSLTADRQYHSVVSSYTSPVITSATDNGSRINTRGGYSPRFGKDLCFIHGRDVVLELSTLDFAHAKETVFYYKLGADGDWYALPRGQNKIAFAGIPYGNSQLSLACANPEIDRKAAITTYLISVPFPWYLSWWMFAVYAVLFFLAVWLAVKSVLRRNRRLYEQRTREKSLELSRQKMDFFVNMSHELKTPLSLVIAPLGALLSESQSETMRLKLASILENAQRLNDIISRILDFKSMEYESEDTLLRSHVELCTLLRNCMASFESVCRERGVTIRHSFDPDNLWLNVDQMKLDSIFTNLLSNAVKYVEDGTGVVSMTLSADSEKVEVCIADNGTGMAEEDIPMMSVRFFQGKNARQRGGTGIGFYLVKKFTEMHGGSVKVRNSHGLAVTVEIPLSGDNRITEVLPTVEKEESAGDDPLPSVLLVDDNHEITEFLSEALSADYRCLSACDGNRALEILKQTKPDIMIVDQMMPGMSGLELCARLRRNRQTAAIPVIMLTAKDDIQTEMDSLKIGIDVFIPKPFDLKKLRLQIHRLLQKRADIEKTVSLKAIANPVFTVDERKSEDERLLEEITRLVESNMADEQFNVAALAQMLGTNPRQLCRKLSQIMDLSPVAYVRKLRMKKAAVLLREDKFTVSEVMYMVGYSNASYFTKCFTAEFGVSPKQWKAENNGGNVSAK